MPEPSAMDGAGVQAPSVSIITVNYNGLRHLAACFDSLRRLDYPPDRFEVICVDNDSADGSVEYMREHYPEVRVIEAGGNLGFAAGCNLGVEHSRAEHIAFLNNDAHVDPRWLTALVAAVSTDAETVCAAAKILDWEGRSVDFVEGHLSYHGFARQTHWREPVRPGAFETQKPLLFACGGAMLVERAVYVEVGGFDERFWMFFEDVDLGWRLWLLGYRVVFAPEAVTYHRHHASAAQLTDYKRNFLYERNGLMMLFKNYEQATLDRVLPAALMLMVHRTTDYLQRAGDGYDNLEPDRWNRFDLDAMERSISLGDLAPLVAIRAVMQELPALMEDRRAIQSRRKRSDREVLPLFGQPRRMYHMGHMLVQSYCEAHQLLWQHLRIDEIFRDCQVRVALLTTAGLPSLGFPESPEGARADALLAHLVAAGHDVVACMPKRLLEAHPDARVDRRMRRFAWDDRNLDNRLIRLGPDVIVATHWRALAFARLSAYRPIVLDHADRDPLPVFETEIQELYELERERKHARRMLRLRDYLKNVDLFTCASDAQLQEMRGWLRDTGMVDPAADQLLVADGAARPALGERGPTESAEMELTGLDRLERFCRLSRYHPEKLPVGYAPPLPKTPFWLLPAKALRTLDRKGAAALVEDTRRYGRWIRHGIERKLAEPRGAKAREAALARERASKRDPESTG